MSARHISVFDGGDAEMRTALAAGWRRTDLVWERLQVRGNAAWVNGERIGARRNFLIAWWLARIFFRRGDPRIATSSANVGLIAREAGQIARASRHYATAQRLWVDVPHMVDGLQIRPRVRSSLFHLRMEVRHRGTYEENTRARLIKFVNEAGEALEAAARSYPSPHRLYSRWRGECPAVFDDSRKLLGAALLICAPEYRETDPDSPLGRVDTARTAKPAGGQPAT